jgi:hypothetical protein
VTTQEYLSWSGTCWILPVPSTEINIDRMALLWCYWHIYEFDGWAENFHKMAMFSTTFQSLAEAYIFISGLFEENVFQPIVFVLYVSDLKWFQQHIEATIYGVLYFLAESFARDPW